MFEPHFIARNSLMLRVCVLLWSRTYWHFSIKWKCYSNDLKLKYLIGLWQNSGETGHTLNERKKFKGRQSNREKTNTEKQRGRPGEEAEKDKGEEMETERQG